MGSITGHTFRISTFGESHGPALGVTIEGIPANFPIDLTQVQADLDRRKPGQSKISTTRKEKDQIEVLSGMFNGHSTGTPLTLLIRNQDARSKHYDHVKDLYRPGHGDYSYQMRYGIRDWRGGGRASARETVARVAAAAIARQWLLSRYQIEVLAWVSQVGTLQTTMAASEVNQVSIESNIIRCPDQSIATQMIQLIQEIKKQGDTIGGCVRAVARNVPAGWGSPVFDKLEADLAKACLSLPACKGFEIGSGFSAVRMKGSEHNDTWNDEGSWISNHAGGVLAGISSGAPIEIQCAFKPVSTHFKPQHTMNKEGELVAFRNEGRHDPCVVARAVPLVEAAMLLTLMDHALRSMTIKV